MNRTRFEEPVTVLVGMGLPVRIETVMEAYTLLQDWPAASRNGTHAIALNACKAGIAGEIDPETVRSTFVAFAHRNDMLVPNMGALMPAVSTDEACTIDARAGRAWRTKPNGGPNGHDFGSSASPRKSPLLEQGACSP